MNNFLKRYGASHKEKTTVRFNPKKIGIIALAVVIVFGSLLILQGKQLAFAATTLKIIQYKEDTSRPLKKFIYVGERLDFDVMLNGEPVGGLSSKWSWKVSNSNLAFVEANGTVNGVASGTITLTVTYAAPEGNKSANISLQIKRKVTSITPQNTSLSISTGSASSIGNVSIIPSNATDISRGVTYTSSNMNVATVDSSGKVKGIFQGNAVITITFVNLGVLTNASGKSKDELITATCSVHVENIHPTGIDLSHSDIGIYAGYTPFSLKATVNPSNSTIKTVNWTSSDNSVATVDSSGTVRGIAEGEATISATTVDGGKKATCAVEVTAFDFDQISLDSNNLTIYVGRKDTLQATYLPDSGDASWKIEDSEIASIQTSGSRNNTCTITALAAGDTIITVSVMNGSTEVEKSCTLKIRNVPLEGIELNQQNASAFTGETLQLSGKVLPSDVTGHTVTWESSDPEIATVDQNGLVRMLKSNIDRETGEPLGDCIIAATVTGTDEEGNEAEFYDTCSIKVSDVRALSITLDQTTLDLTPGDAPVKLGVTVNPSNTTNKEVSYISENDAIADVSDDGYITAVAGGTADIKVISEDDSDIFATCEVKVTPPYSPDIKVLNDSVIVGIDHKEYIQILSAPGPVSFESAETSIVTVDENGYLSGVNRGTASVTLSAIDDKTKATVTKTINVKVIRFVEEIIFTKDLWILNAPGGSSPVGVTVLPEDADNKELAWESSNPVIARVDNDGCISK
jgi:uncharacterized protein YjdB